jgi:hypothetical protein
MLVKFTCKAHADITMFGDVAKHLLTLMGHSGTVPGAIRAEDIPEAIERLKRAMEEDAESEAAGGEDEEEDAKVSLSRRAWPLVSLLTAARREGCIVMWESTRS